MTKAGNRNFKGDKTSLKEVLGMYCTYTSPRQQEALKTNKELQAYGEAVETMMDALGIDETYLRSLLEQSESTESIEDDCVDFKIVGCFSSPTDDKHNGVRCRKVGYTIEFPEESTIADTLKWFKNKNGRG